jgi:quercetin dioxygenase-like cupin family protein
MEELWLAGNRFEIHLTGDETGGSLCVLVDHPPTEFTLVQHRHANEDETIHVIEGTFEFFLEGATRRLGPGDTVHVPRGSLHGIRNVGEAAGKRVLVFHPAGLEAFFRAAGTPDPQESRPAAELLALCERHGWSFG